MSLTLANGKIRYPETDNCAATEDCAAARRPLFSYQLLAKATGQFTLASREKRLRPESKDGAEGNGLGILRDERFQEAAGLA
jgi:hypothetical protein